jgi:uncharacterized protein
MTTQMDATIAQLLRPMLKKKLFVALSKAVATSDQMLPPVAEHLAHMNRIESEGELFASGPFLEEGVLVGDGLTILQTDTLDEARAIMLAEPLIELGMREFDLRLGSFARAV